MLWLCGNTGSNTSLTDAVVSISFWTAHARQDCECLLCKRSRGSSSAFSMSAVIAASSEMTALLLQWTTEELAGTTASSKHTPQGEGKEMVKALFHLHSGQWTCSILRAEDRPCKKGVLVTPCITAYHELFF